MGFKEPIRSLFEWISERGDSKAVLYDTHQRLREHLASFVLAYSHAKRLKSLKGVTAYEYMMSIWEQERDRLITNPSHFTIEPDSFVRDSRLSEVHNNTELPRKLHNP